MWLGFREQFRRRPFVPLVLGLASGIVASRIGSLEIWVGVIAFCVAIAALLLPPVRLLACVMLAFGYGAAFYAARYAILSPNDLRLLIEDKPALVSIRGRLLETPAVREYPGRTSVMASSYARIAVDEILIEKEWRAAIGTVASTTRGLLDSEFFKGRRVELSGVIELPKAARAPGMFDFRQYLYNCRVFYQVKCDGASDWRLLSSEALPVPERFRSWAHGQLARGLPFQDEPVELVRAMALGTNQSLSGEVAQPFMKTGTLHIFAISGLHVACIAACILTLLRCLGMARDRAALVLIPLVWFYTLATGWQSSAVRSALMSTFVFAGWAIRRPTELLNSTAGAALLILLFEPEQLFQASFELSFVVVAAIAVILGVSREEGSWTATVQSWMLGHDPLVPVELRPGWKRWVEWPVGLVLGNLAISAASWVGSTPLTAYYFNLVTPVSLLANVVAVPLSSMALASTLGSLLVPPLGPWFNYVSWALMWATVVVTRWLAGFGWGYFYTPRPGVWFFVGYGAGVVLGLCRFMKGRGWARGCAVLGLGLGICAVVGLGWAGRVGRAGWPGGAAVVTLLPAPGNVLVLDGPGGRELINGSTAREAARLVGPFLHAQGFGRVEDVILSQGDVSHAGGLTNLWAEFAPQRVFVGAGLGRGGGRSGPYRRLIADLESVPGRLHRVGAGEEVRGWRVLHPRAGEGWARAADGALVLQTEVCGWRLLYLGDLGVQGQNALLQREPVLCADVVFAGVTEEPAPELFRRIAPRLIVVGAVEGPFNRKARGPGRPGRAGQGLERFGVPVATTANDCAVTLELTAAQCTVQSGDRVFTIAR